MSGGKVTDARGAEIAFIALVPRGFADTLTLRIGVLHHPTPDRCARLGAAPPATETRAGAPCHGAACDLGAGGELARQRAKRGRRPPRGFARCRRSTFMRPMLRPVAIRGDNRRRAARVPQPERWRVCRPSEP